MPYRFQRVVTNRLDVADTAIALFVSGR